MVERSWPIAAAPGRGTGPAIQLAGVADFSLGRLEVRPSRGEIQGEGPAERLEPRVMQALVALSARAGRTISRQELIDQCWGGVVVGRDALNRVISILRRLSARTDRAFRIETLPRIGYRLVAEVTLDERAPDPTAESRLIAVLPFDGDGPATALAEGVTEAILSALTRHGGVAVAARHSSLQFRGARKPDAGRALGVSHLVDGSVAVAGDRVLVTAYLIDARRQVTLWSDRIDGAIGGLFQVQDQIARRVVETFDLQLGRAAQAGPADPEVYDLYAHAMLALEQPAREPVEQALAYLKEVTARAPDFALGWAGLAEGLRRRLLYSPPPLQEPALTQSRQAAERALELDPGLGQAYGTLANLLPRFNRWAEVETLFNRGLGLAPNSPELRHQHALFLMAVGRSREGLEALLALQRLNPLSASVSVEVASALFDCGQETAALAAVDRAYGLWPTIVLVWSESVRLHMMARDYATVLALLDAPPPSISENDPNIARRRLHTIARRDRRPEDLAAAAANFRVFAEVGGAPAVVAVHALTTLGRDDDALQIARRIFGPDGSALAQPGVNMMGTFALAGEPDSSVLFRADTASMRGAAAFGAILQAIGLEDYWRRAGIVPDFRRLG
jgi:TolB-like protein